MKNAPCPEEVGRPFVTLEFLILYQCAFKVLAATICDSRVYVLLEMRLLSVVYLTDDLADPLCRKLREAGHLVSEAFSVDEALWLCSQYRASIVVISAKFRDPKLFELQQRYSTIKLVVDTLEDTLAELAKAS